MYYDKLKIARRIALLKLDNIRSANYKGVNDERIGQLHDFIDFIEKEIAQQEVSILEEVAHKFRFKGGAFWTDEEASVKAAQAWRQYQESQDVPA